VELVGLEETVLVVPLPFAVVTDPVMVGVPINCANARERNEMARSIMVGGHLAR
jgi:hypothetical protein